MKTTKYLLLSGLLSVGAFASGSKTPKPDVDPATKPQVIMPSDTEAILGQRPATTNVAFWLTAGLYDVGDLDDQSLHSYMLVENSANDPNSYLAMIFPRKALENDGHPFEAYIYYGKRIAGNSKVMLSPLGIDNNGNLSILSEGRRDAPVIEVWERAKNFKLPVVLNGRNGGINGKQWAARASSRKTPSLNGTPSSGFFAAGNRRDGMTALVNNSQLSIAKYGSGDSTFEMIPMNGGLGRFTGLVKSKLDTMTGTEIQQEAVHSLAVFISSCWDREVMLLASPTANASEGVYSFRFYRMGEPALVESWFPGKVRHPSN